MVISKNIIAWKNWLKRWPKTKIINMYGNMNDFNKATIICDIYSKPSPKFKYYDKIVFNTLFDKKSLFDSDFIIVNFNNLIKVTESLFDKIVGKERAFFGMTDHLSVDTIVQMIQSEYLPHIKKDLIDFLKTGKNIYVIINNEFTIPTGNPYDFSSIFTPVFYCLSKYEGQDIQCINHRYQDFYSKLKDSFNYKAYFKDYPNPEYDSTVSNTFCIKNNPNRVVGFEKRYENGKIVFLPHIDISSENIFEKFLDALIDLENSYNTEYPIPEWSKNYQIPDEKQIVQEIDRLNQELEKIRSQIFINEESYSELLKTKALFTCNDDPFEEQCLKVFIELGFKQLPGKKNRSDLILSYDDKFVVAELKGVGKSAAESHATQLEKWVIEFKEEHDNIQPKPILIINGYRHIPLEERNQSVFPHSMLKYSINRDHCLITGIQMACIYYEILKDPSKKVEIVDKLFNTVGVFEDYNDWKNYIDYEPESKS